MFCAEFYGLNGADEKRTAFFFKKKKLLIQSRLFSPAGRFFVNPPPADLLFF
jgi:hypothetical protein